MKSNSCCFSWLRAFVLSRLLTETPFRALPIALDGSAQLLV
jgi:hypothetical protein